MGDRRNKGQPLRGWSRWEDALVDEYVVAIAEGRCRCCVAARAIAARVTDRSQAAIYTRLNNRVLEYKDRGGRPCVV